MCEMRGYRKFRPSTFSNLCSVTLAALLTSPSFSMEFQLPALLLASVMMLMFIVLKLRKRSETTAPTSKLPPGPTKLPIIGSMHHMLGSLPHKTLANLAKKYGPLMHLQLGEISVIVVSSAEVAKEIMKTHDIIFSQRPDILGPTILSYGRKDVIWAPYGEFWRQLRKVCILELLSAKRVHSFQTIREDEVRNLTQELSETAGSPVNFSKKMFMLTNNVTARTAFGDRNKDQLEFKAVVDETLKIVGGLNIVDFFPSSNLFQAITGIKQKFMSIRGKLDVITGRIIEAHREKKRLLKTKIDGNNEVEDLVDVLLRVQQHGDLGFDLSDETIKATLIDVFAAGTETSSTTMEWAMSLLLKNPHAMLKVQEEIRNTAKAKENNRITEADIGEMIYFQSVIKETFRLCPPVPLLLPRESTETCEIIGYEIPKKTRVLVNFWAIGRDPKYWENPEAFVPERFLESSVDFRGQHFEFIPFGSGRRGCPGILFGLATVELALANLLLHFDWKLPNGMKDEDLDMSEFFGITMGRKSSLQVVAIPHFA